MYFSNNPIALSGEFAGSMEAIGAEPLMPFALKPEMLINQTLSIIFITFFAVIYLFVFVLRFDVLKAMKN